jgi:hypothetical protein
MGWGDLIDNIPNLKADSGGEFDGRRIKIWKFK